MSKTPPPLNALKAFEVAARHASFVLAGEELGVTAAAVSQLVRKLEQHLGKKLFERFNNRINLTDAGRALFNATSPAMTELAEAVGRAMRRPTRRKLRLSVVPSLAESWLLHALPKFLESNPRIRIDISIEDRMANAGADIRINYGRMPADDWIQEDMLRDDVLPCCSPRFLAELGGSVDFTAALSGRLIHTQWGELFGSNATWRDWFAANAPGEHVDMSAGHDVNTSRAALQLAEAGIGIALGQRLMAQHSFFSGTLVAASPASLPLGQSYFLAVPISRARHPDVQAFKTWLSSAAKSAAVPETEDIGRFPPRFAK